MTPDPNIERLDEDWTPVYEHVPPHPMCCDECKQARADLEAAREALREAVSLLRAVVEADKQDALMGHPNPGDSCIAAVIGLAVMEWLESPSAALAAPDPEGDDRG